MTCSFRKTLLAASVSLSALFAANATLAQEAVFVTSSNEVGVPTLDPIRANNLGRATTLIFDRLVSQAADLSYHPGWPKAGKRRPMACPGPSS